MIAIEKMILHVCEPDRNELIQSESEMAADEQWLPRLESKLTKAFTGTQKKTGQFHDESQVKQVIREYATKTISFVQMSRRISERIFAMKCKYGLYEASTLFFGEVLFDDVRYVVCMDNAHQEALSHILHEADGKVCLNLHMNTDMIASSLLKKDAAFMICLADFSVSSVEGKTMIEGEKRYFYNDIILQAQAKTSYHDALVSMEKACDEVVRDYALESIKIKPKLKQAIKESLEAQEELQPVRIAQEVFYDQPLAAQHFTQQLKDQGISEAIPTEHHKPSKAERVTKLRTDKGIELIIPLEYMDSTDYVEFQNEENGSISIRLKNINRIINR